MINVALSNLSPLDQSVFDSNFHVVHSASALSQAHVVLLTEGHLEPDTWMKNAWLIHRLYRKGDIVIVEESCKAQINQRFSQICYASKPLNTIGWDDEESVKALNAEQLILNPLLKELSYENCFDDSWFIKIDDLLKPTFTEENIELNPTEIKNRQVLQIKIDQLKLQTQQSVRQRYSGLLTLLKDLKELRLNTYYKNLLKKTWNARQLSLLNTINSHASTTKRIFVIAGDAHLLTHAEGAFARDERAKAKNEDERNELNDYLYNAVQEKETNLFRSGISFKSILIDTRSMDNRIGENLKEDVQIKKAGHLIKFKALKIAADVVHFFMVISYILAKAFNGITYIYRYDYYYHLDQKIETFFSAWMNNRKDNFTKLTVCR